MDDYKDPSLARIERLRRVVSELDRHALAARGLTSRQIEVASHVAVGMANKDIAVALGISLPTVKEHVGVVLRKLGVENRTELASLLLQEARAAGSPPAGTA
jgi:DNA-binding NarL/FixJ family response regulator